MKMKTISITMTKTVPMKSIIADGICLMTKTMPMIIEQQYTTKVHLFKLVDLLWADHSAFTNMPSYRLLRFTALYRQINNCCASVYEANRANCSTFAMVISGTRNAA